MANITDRCRQMAMQASISESELQVILNLELNVINLKVIRLPNTARSADILMTLSVAIIAELLVNLKHVMK